MARLALLTEAFAVDICAYAVMSNHYHVVLKINADQAEAWDDNEVLERWGNLFAGHTLVQRYLADEGLCRGELSKITEFISLYRHRLTDLSWFMRCLNEPIARMANQEDGCTGRFWEGRFKSQALLDEQALISCMAYVDLNPIRAGIADTPENSEFTSIQQRIDEGSGNSKQPELLKESLDLVIPRLLGFSGRLDDDQGLPCASLDYIKLVDWAGRAIHPIKRGKIDDALPPILQRLGIEPVNLLCYLNRKERGFVNVIGAKPSIVMAATRLGVKFLKGITAANRLFPQRI